MSEKLPKEPSALIRLALTDLRKVEDDERYRINMEDDWHRPGHDVVCQVCLAGAVMAMTLHISPGIYTTPSDHGHDATRLSALNDFRRGMIYFGLEKIGLHTAASEWYKEDGSDIFNRAMPSYDPDAPEAFHAAMRGLTDEMEARGI